jgi:GT2 family glycosyltransferase
MNAARSDPEQDDAILREEIDQLARIVDAQESTIASLRHEIHLHSVAIGWRLQLRLEDVRSWMLATPVMRQIYRTFYRALEIWVDEGFLMIFARTGTKIGMALRGRSPLVEDRDRLPRAKLDDELYYHWIRRHGTSPKRPALEAVVQGFTERPLISVLATLPSADPARLRGLLATLQRQVYENWELSVAVTRAVSSQHGRVWDELATSEPRLRIATSEGDLPLASDALAVARGVFITFLDADDELPPEAFVALVQSLHEDPTTDVIYSDEDSLSGDRREEPVFKPDWSPDLLLSSNYLERLGLFRRTLVDEVGGLRPECRRAQVYDLVLRLSEKTSRISHVPRVLCHRRRRPMTVETILERHAANRDECRAIAGALERRDRPGQVEAIFIRGGPRCYSVRFALRERPLVSIVIPTKDRRALLQTTLDSIWTRTDYDRYEVIVVDNGSTEGDAIDYLSSIASKCQVLKWNERFNYSAINNFGVRHARGEQLLFLNNDMEVARPDWLTAMLEHAVRPEVGAVGAKLVYGDGRIQHAGVVVGINRAAANAFRQWPGERVGNPRYADLTRNCSAVTGACMMMPRRVFDEVGGFDERLRVVLNDVDLCLRIRRKGYLIVYTPHAQLYHYEGASRGMMHPPADQKLFEQRWKDVLDRCDPYYNPNLTPNRDDWSFRVDLEGEEDE